MKLFTLRERIVKMNMKENEIIELAKENLTEIANLEWKEGGRYDKIINLNFNNYNLKFDAEIKNEIRANQIHRYINDNKITKDFIIIAKIIYKEAKEQLRELNIPYIEANGNMFYNKNNIFFWIENNKPIITNKEKGNRAFTKTGLKVLFNFLLDADLVNKTQREIADQTGVALGNIPQIINGLVETGFLLKLNRNEFVWEKRQELLDRWINDYETVLRPHLKKGSYATNVDWQEIQLNNTTTVWGGEPAADLLTHHLRPEKLILYTYETQLELMKKYKLLPDQKGDLEIIEMFWNPNTNMPTAPPLLVYADLIIEGGKRNKETAEIIYNEYIQANI